MHSNRYCILRVTYRQGEFEGALLVNAADPGRRLQAHVALPAEDSMYLNPNGAMMAIQ